MDLRGPDGRDQADHDTFHSDGLLGQCQGLCAVAVRRPKDGTDRRDAHHSVLR